MFSLIKKLCIDTVVRYPLLRNVEKQELTRRVICRNCKYEVGRYYEGDLIYLTKIRLMKSVPHIFRVQCRAPKSDQSHGHAYRVETLVMPIIRGHRVFTSIEYYDQERQPMKDPCPLIPGLPALFDQGLGESMKESPILKLVIVNKTDSRLDVAVEVSDICLQKLCHQKKLIYVYFFVL